jgi:4-oxalocrotonate tautomerase
MPRIIIQLIRGRSVEQKRELARRLTDDVVEVFGVEPEIVTIRFEEVEAHDFARGGILSSDRGRRHEAPGD